MQDSVFCTSQPRPSVHMHSLLCLLIFIDLRWSQQPVAFVRIVWCFLHVGALPDLVMTECYNLHPTT